MLLASSGSRPRMLLNILQCMGLPLPQRTIQPLNVKASWFRTVPSKRVKRDQMRSSKIANKIYHLFPFQKY